MPKFDKPDSPNIIWGVNALEGDLTRPDDSYIQTGWTQVKPPYEYENYSMNKLYQGFAYYNQLGFPEWDSATEYQSNKSYVQGSNNRVYKCIQTHSNRNPATAGNEAFWEVFEGNRQATTTSRGTVELATNTETANGVLDNIAVSPANLLSGLLGIGVFSTNGHGKIPMNVGGERREFIIQWGTSNLSSAPDVINFPIAFPNVCLGSSITRMSSPSNSVEYAQVTQFGLSSFNVTSYTRIDVDNAQGGFTISWVAFGF